MTHDSALEQTARALAGGGPVVVLTGAGISAESGVPTFRGPGGLWQGHRAEDLATPDAFRRDPRMVWDFYNWRRELIAPLLPNAAHEALVKLEKSTEDSLLLTQNVDGLHREAGSRRILEIHGNIWRVSCTRCGEVREDRTVPLPWPPSCHLCGGLLRPHVVWFGEALEVAMLARAWEALESCEVLLVIGTSGLVQPAASFAGVAKHAGAFVAELNLEPGPFTDQMDAVITGPAGQTVPALVRRALEIKGSAGDS
jgi:NAD-dependent deacetylase